MDKMKKKVVLNSMNESIIYEGRIQKNELEYYLNLDELTSPSAALLNLLQKEKLTEIFNQIECKFNRIMNGIMNTYSDWYKYGFNVGHNFECSSHSGAGMNKLFLIESGKISKKASGSNTLADIEIELENINDEIDKRKIWSDNTNYKLKQLQKLLSEIKSNSNNIIINWECYQNNCKEKEIEELICKCQEYYEEAIDIILRYLPGRSFINNF